MELAPRLGRDAGQRALADEVVAEGDAVGPLGRQALGHGLLQRARRLLPGPLHQRLEVGARQGAARHRERGHDGPGVAAHLAEARGDDPCRVALLAAARQGADPERRARSAPHDGVPLLGAEVGRDAPRELQGLDGRQRLQVHQDEPERALEPPPQGGGEPLGPRRGPARGDERQRVRRGRGRAHQVVAERQREVVDPLEVVDRDDHHPEGPPRGPGGLEDAHRLERPAPAQLAGEEGRQAGAVARRARRAREAARPPPPAAPRARARTRRRSGAGPGSAPVASASRRLLPCPAGPRISAAPGRPSSATRRSRSARAASSASRPTNGSAMVRSYPQPSGPRTPRRGSDHGLTSTSSSCPASGVTRMAPSPLT